MSVLCASSAWADTVYLKDKQEIRGVIVEEFADRYVVRTIDGEKPILKTQAAAVKYDDPELSYYQLGKDLQRAGRLREALSAYQKAAELRPNFQAASSAVFGVQRMLDRQDEPELLAEVRQKQVALEQAGRPFSGRPTAGADRIPADSFGTIEKRFGMALRQDEEWIVVARVQPRSAAAAADVRSGDRLVAVSGEPLGHLKSSEAVQRLEAQVNELQLSIEREVSLEHPRAAQANKWGMQVELGYDGLRVKEVDSGGPAAGRCQAGDLVVAMDLQPTRYMPMSRVEQRMSQEKPLALTIQRGVFIRQQSDKAPSK